MNKANPSADFTAANAALSELEVKFDHWRKHKSYARECIPIELLEAAQALTQHMNVTTVKNRLGISGDQLKRAQQVSPQNSFVPVKTQSTEPVRIDMHFPNGARVSIDGLKHDPKQILSQLLENLNDCA